MEEEQAVIYGLEHPSRALCAQTLPDGCEQVRFLVGTASVRQENQVHVIDYDEEADLLTTRTLQHPKGEVWSIASAADGGLFATLHRNSSGGGGGGGAGEGHGVSIYTSVSALVNENENENEGKERSSLGEDETPSLSPACSLLGNTHQAVCWHPSNGQRLATMGRTNLTVWDLGESGGGGGGGGGTSAKAATTVKGVTDDSHPASVVCRWNPHQGSQLVATAIGSTIQGWDLRSGQSSFLVARAHDLAVRSVDFNPNRQYYMATGGDDGTVRFWDIRASSHPLAELSEHTHWVWSVRYNPFHDQLVLSGGSDGLVALSNLASLSSDLLSDLAAVAGGGGGGDEPEAEERDRGEEEEEEEGKGDDAGADTIDETGAAAGKKELAVDGLLRGYDEHEDSVYSAEWSATDPWMFASLSYDGRLVLNRVPRQTKYSILL